MDECLSRSHECDEVATCVNTEGSYTCECPEGYVANGTKCDGMLSSVKSAEILRALG